MRRWCRYLLWLVKQHRILDIVQRHGRVVSSFMPAEPALCSGLSGVVAIVANTV
jgi:hypothetical protein